MGDGRGARAGRSSARLDVAARLNPQSSVGGPSTPGRTSGRSGLTEFRTARASSAGRRALAPVRHDVATGRAGRRPRVRPTRLRALLPDGRIAFAVVARPARLRRANESPTGGRQRGRGELPLDVETVRMLERRCPSSTRCPRSPANRRRQAPAGAERRNLGCRPRRPHGVDAAERRGGARIPPLYLRRGRASQTRCWPWSGASCGSTRANGPRGRTTWRASRSTSRTSGHWSAPSRSRSKRPRSRATVRPWTLRAHRYRAAFRRLFDRGLTFLGSNTNAILAACAFEYLLRLVEDLRTHSVKLEGRTEPLMPADQLRRISLELLESYLGRGEHDPTCLASARVHLAALVRQRTRFAPLERERLEALCFTWASELVALPGDLIAPAPSALDLDVPGAIPGSRTTRSDPTGPRSRPRPRGNSTRDGSNVNPGR